MADNPEIKEVKLKKGSSARRGSPYTQVYDYLSSKIERGSYELNEMLPTEQTLATQFGVSRPTVSKALRRLQEEGWLVRRPGSGTFIAKTTGRRIWNVGLVVPGLGEIEIYEPMCRAIANVSHQENLRLTWTAASHTTHDYASRIEDVCVQCIDQRLDGVFFAPLQEGPNWESVNVRALNDLINSDMQIVLLDHDIRKWPRRSACDWVGVDHMQAGYIMAEHLIQQGCERLVFAKQPEQGGTILLRQMGCREAVMQSKQALHPLHLCKVDTENLQQTVDDIIQSQADGLICSNDALAASLLRAIVDRGIQVPEQLRVVGFDDIRYASLISIPLTTYHHPVEDIGRQAANMMQMRLLNPNRPTRSVTLAGELVIRRSSCSSNADIYKKSDE